MQNKSTHDTQHPSPANKIKLKRKMHDLHYIGEAVTL